MPTVDVLVIGAGLAGLTAARRLAREGRSVVVLDKGRGVGGRMATRRVGAARIDHGAQFFTVRSRDFAATVDGWRDAGVVREWCRGFRQPEDGHPRYVGVEGMSSVAKDLAAGLDVHVATRVTAVRQADAGWAVRLEAGGSLEGRAVLATAPVPQTLDLLGAVAAALDPGALDALAAVRYDPTMAALVALEEASSVPPPGGVQLDDGLIRWVGDNRAKGVSSVPAVTLHASGPDSAARWDQPATTTLAALLGAGARWLGHGPVREAQLMRWRYAQPTVSHPERCLAVADGPAPLVCAGDAFGEARVEGAYLSGAAAAELILDRLT